MKLIDITLPLSKELAGWPGDAPFAFEWTAEIERDSPVNIGSLRMSAHFGTHIDAPFHFNPKGATAERVRLEALCGPAVVVDAAERDCIGPDIFDEVDLAATPRVLIRTNAWTDHRRFPNFVPTLSTKAIRRLSAAGAVLLGVDVPSVDPLESKLLSNHHLLDAANIAVIESLDLREAVPGTYTLIAAPLLIAGGDAAPLRAFLIPLGEHLGE